MVVFVLQSVCVIVIVFVSQSRTYGDGFCVVNSVAHNFAMGLSATFHDFGLELCFVRGFCSSV